MSALTQFTEEASFKSAKPRLLTYQHIWMGKDRHGDHQYEYHCTWSDGSDSMEFTLPWAEMGDAVELPMTSLREFSTPKPTTLEEATDFFCTHLMERNAPVTIAAE